MPQGHRRRVFFGFSEPSINNTSALGYEEIDQARKRGPGVAETTITQWRHRLCASAAEVFDIPFAELGEFVYHCHILEHEDGGMMARIKVVAH